MGSVAALSVLLQETHRRGQEQWFAPNRLTDLRRLRLCRLIQATATTSITGRLLGGSDLKPSELTQDGILSLLRSWRKPRSNSAVRVCLPVRHPRPGYGSDVRVLRPAARGYRSAEDQAQVSAAWARIFEPMAGAPSTAR